MVKEHWRNDTDRDKPKYSENILSHCFCPPLKSPMDWPGTEVPLMCLKTEHRTVREITNDFNTQMSLKDSSQT
jgi:hypothetical protein